MYCVVCINRACLLDVSLVGCAAADVCCSEAHDISVRHLMLDVMAIILREAEHIPKGILLQLLASDEVHQIHARFFVAWPSLLFNTVSPGLRDHLMIQK